MYIYYMITAHAHKIHPTHAFLCSTIGVVAFILVSEWFGGLSTGEKQLNTTHATSLLAEYITQ